MAKHLVSIQTYEIYTSLLCLQLSVVQISHMLSFSIVAVIASWSPAPMDRQGAIHVMMAIGSPRYLSVH